MSAFLSPELSSQADRYLESEANRNRFTELGGRYFEVFGYDRKSSRISSQVRNLQQIACSASRFADIEDFVKNQMGKESKDNKWRQVGEETLRQLGALRNASKDVPAEGQLPYRLWLVRGWVRAVVAEYLYRIALDQMEVGHV
jgi:hypothetical protein